MMFSHIFPKDKYEQCSFVDCISIACFSVLFITVCSITTSPFFPIPTGGDSAIFLTIGKYWNFGKIPYIDLWDLKGPLIFLFNAVGYRLTETRTGVYILQIIWMYVSFIFIFKILRIRYPKKFSYLLLFLIYGTYSLNYQTGNSVEECCMPFLSSSFYLLAKWFEQQKNKQDYYHPWTYAFTYGVCFGACFLTRITNAIGICVACLYISVILFLNHRFDLFLQNLIGFLAGFVLISAPFVIYFLLNNALSEFWYGTIGYNLEYAKNSVSILSRGLSYERFITSFFWLLSPLLLGSVAIQHVRKGDKKYALWLVISLFTITYLLLTNGYLHYGAIALPYTPIVLILMKTDNMKTDIIRKCTVLILMLICSGIGAINVLKSYYYQFYVYKSHLSEEPNDVAVELCQQIPLKDRDSFIAYNCKDGIYLYLDVCPCYRFFAMQDWEVSQGESLKPKMIDTFESCDAKWILMNSASDETILSIVKEHYHLIDYAQIPYTNNYYELYCKD